MKFDLVKADAVDFNEPIMRNLLWNARGVGMCAYAVALAAFQRGLKVTFHYEFHSKTGFFASNKVQGCRGEMFSITDGKKIHFFNRSQGDLTPNDASALSNDKQKTKKLFLEKGVPVADGILVNRGEDRRVAAFLKKHPGRQFIIKPIDGSLGRGVERNLAPEDVIAALGKVDERSYLLEEQVNGLEYRLYVVDGKCYFAGLRVAARVTGDGKSSIARLIALANKTRERHPYYFDKPIKASHEMIHMLQQQSMTLKDIPNAGQVVRLSNVDSVHAGGSMLNVTDQLPDWVKQIGVDAQRASGLPFCGIDIIVEHKQESKARRAIVLETNSRAHIQQSLLGPDYISYGNAVAEAIVNYYFPASINNKRHIKAAFNFRSVLRSLETGVASEITLPVIGHDWVHERSKLPSKDLMTVVRRKILQQGIHGGVYELSDGSVWLDVLTPAERYRKFIHSLKD